MGNERRSWLREQGKTRRHWRALLAVWNQLTMVVVLLREGEQSCPTPVRNAAVRYGSGTSKFYALRSLAEAEAYFSHQVLGARLIECLEALQSLPTNDSEAVLGSIDAAKLRSCLTLFLEVAPTKQGKRAARDSAPTSFICRSGDRFRDCYGARRPQSRSSIEACALHAEGSASPSHN